MKSVARATLLQAVVALLVVGALIYVARSAPFLAAPDRTGRRLPFAIAWASDGDMSGGGVVRAAGPGAALVRGTMDSTDVYRVLHAAIFVKPAR